MSTVLIGVTGTDTGVGKTVVAAALAATLRAQGLSVAATKLVATGVSLDAGFGEDADLLGRAAGRNPRDCVLQTFTPVRSPLAAARAEGRAVDVDALIAAIDRLCAEGSDVVVLEGVGGLLVPIRDDATVATLFRRCDARTLIVGRAGLGTINHCALTVDAARNAGLRLLGVVLSDSVGTDPGFARENADQVAAQCDVRVFGVLPQLGEPGDIDSLAATFAKHVDVEAIVQEARRPRPARASVIQADRSNVWHPFTQATEWADEEPLVIRSGDGCWLVDEDGRRYLDGIASLWANVHGHAHRELDRALHTQAGRIAHSTFLGQTHAPGALLAEELARITPPGLTRVFYSEAGAAAVEVALRVALLAQQRRGRSGRTRFISLEEAYHGDTAGAVSVGRSEPFHRGLDSMLFDVVRCPSPYAVGEQESLAQLHGIASSHADEIAALLIEPRMQGAAGMLPHSDAWLRGAAAVARRAGMLVICDEVATGFGRTGDLFASAGAGLEPDILVLGKGLSGGYLPLSATVVNDDLYGLFTGAYEEHRTLYYGHTYSGNPLACAVARASLRLFDTEHTVDRGRALAAHVERGLQEIARLDIVFDVRRRGVMTGIEVRSEDGLPFAPSQRVGRQVTLAARRRGVIVRPLGDTLVLNPALVMSEAEADLLLSVAAESIAEVGARVRTPAGIPSAGFQTSQSF